MNVFLAGTDSLKFTRLARASPDLVLEPAGNAHRELAPGILDVPALRLALPEEVIPAQPGTPLNLTFFSRGNRSGAHGVRSRALLADLPENTFLEVLRASGEPWPCAGNEPLRLFVESAGLSLVRVEQQLSRQVELGALTSAAAFYRLLTFPMEACGSYARDPVDPAHGPCAFKLPPIATPEGIIAFLEEARGIRGIKRARRAAALVQSGAGSPEETLLSFAYKLPARMGGVEFPPFQENVPIEWPPEVLGLVEHRQMRPDFHWSGQRTASEYNGKDHISEKGFEEDQRRIRDYQACGISVFPASYKNVRTIQALDAYLALIAHSLARTEGPAFERRVRKTLSNPDARQARVVLLSQMLPAVPSEKPTW